MSNDSYASFLTAIARELPCPVANLVESKISWKPQKPVNAPTLPLGGETGFSALVEGFIGKKSGRVVFLLMPPPTKPAEEKPVCCIIHFLVARLLNLLPSSG
jgi:hypothetical protein